MIKKIFIFFMISLPVFAQQDQTGKTKENQNVELPEFVITGVERVNLPAVAKPKADLIPMLGESFFRPEIPTQDLQIAELTNPIIRDVKLFETHTNMNNELMLGIGLHTLPEGNFYFGKSYAHTLLSGNIWGINEFPDTDFASINNSGIGLNSVFFISDNSSFLPGTKFSWSGVYDRESYKFFASDDPGRRRDIHKGDFSLGVENLLSNTFKIGVNLTDSIMYVKDTRLTENLLGSGGYFNFLYKDLRFGGKLNYYHQSLNDDAVNTGRGYVDGSIIAGIETPELLKIKFGFNFAKSNDTKLFLPYGYLGYKINKFISAYGEFNPHANFITVSKLLESNRYYNGAPFNAVQNVEASSTFAVKYEYYTYFEINGGIKYNQYKDYYYFTDKDINGIFESDHVKARSYGAFVNMLFHLGPFGTFYGGANYDILKDFDGNYIPYVAPFYLNMKYAYHFPSNWGIETSLDIYSKRYSNIVNTRTGMIPAYADLSLKLDYELSKNFSIFSSFSNILNQKNYNWTGYRLKPYKGKPFDVVLGIDYTW